MKKIKKAIMATAIISRGNSFYHRTSGAIYHRTAGWAVFLQTMIPSKILTVMAIVTVLPAANLASPLIAIFKYHTPEQAFHEAYMPYEENLKFSMIWF